MYAYDMNIPIMSIYTDLGKTGKLVSDDDITFEDIIRAGEGLFDATGKVTGLPLGYVFETGRAVKGFLDGEYLKALGYLAGWSAYTLEKIKKKKKELPISPKLPVLPTLPTLPMLPTLPALPSF